MFVGYLFCNLSSLFYCAIAAVLSLSLSDASAVHAALMVSMCANNVNKSRPIQSMQRWAIVYRTNIRLLQRWPLGNGIVLYYTASNAPYVGQTNQHLAYAESSAGPRQPGCGRFNASEMNKTAEACRLPCRNGPWKRFRALWSFLKFFFFPLKLTRGT